MARDTAAFLAAILVYAGVSAGLVRFGVPVQVGLLVGATAGLLASRVPDAALIGAAAVLAGKLVSARSSIGGVDLVIAAGVALGAAALVSWGIRAAASAESPARVRRVTALACIAVILANFWFAAVQSDVVGYQGRPPATTYLSQVPEAGERLTDNLFYQRVMWMVAGGEPYYEAFRQAYNENPRWHRDPDMVVSYRFPTLFWIWAALPAKPLSIVLGMALMATLAIGAGAWLATLRAHLAFAVPVAAVLAGYMLAPTISNGMLSMEPWAVPLGIVAVALTTRSLGEPRPISWRTWLMAGVVFAIAATLIRETMGYVILAGLVASLFAEPAERRVRLLAWSAALLAVVAAFALHVSAIAGAVSHGNDASMWLHGGVRSLWLGLTWSTAFLAAAWAVPLCALLAIVGSASQADGAIRAYALAVASLAIAILLLVANESTGGVAEGGQAINYWGMVSGPVLIALAGWAPGALRFFSAPAGRRPVAAGRRAHRDARAAAPPPAPGS